MFTEHKHLTSIIYNLLGLLGSFIQVVTKNLRSTILLDILHTNQFDDIKLPKNAKMLFLVSTPLGHLEELKLRLCNVIIIISRNWRYK